MNEKLREKIRESLQSVLPITCIVMLLCFTLVPMEIGALSLFVCGALLLIIGMGLFQLGAETAMTPFGQGLGGSLLGLKSVIPTAVICFLVGTIITVSEPDLQVLAEQVASIPNSVIIWSVAVGSGAFMVAAVLRIVFHLDLGRMLAVLYLFVFILTAFAPSEFTAVAFDAGGVTTGPMTVPFIMAIGVGLSSQRSDREGASDSFGLLALCSIGPVIMILLLGIFYDPGEALYESVDIISISTTHDIAAYFIGAFPRYAREVTISMLPVMGAFLLFQLLSRRYRRRQILKIAIGFIYTALGLMIFLTGVNVGFAPVGNLLGEEIASSAFRWMLIPIGIVIGYYIVKAEPAVQILNEQVEDITGGTISRRTMNLGLSAGVAADVGLSMLRVLTGISIYWILIPGYALAIGLSFLVPPIFVGVAFDSGGVASGTMTSAFLLPLAMGACTALGGNVITDAFGIIASVSMTPLIAIQLIGLIYALKSSKRPAAAYLVSDDIVLDDAGAGLADGAVSETLTDGEGLI